jgi:hypothetical protein
MMAMEGSSRHSMTFEGANAALGPTADRMKRINRTYRQDAGDNNGYDKQASDGGNECTFSQTVVICPFANVERNYDNGREQGEISCCSILATTFRRDP